MQYLFWKKINGFLDAQNTSFFFKMFVRSMASKKLKAPHPNIRSINANELRSFEFFFKLAFHIKPIIEYESKTSVDFSKMSHCFAMSA